MVTRKDYHKEAVDACLSVMMELFTVLGEFRDHIVLVGGWVPYFLLDKHKDAHTGSLDIDIALDNQAIPDDTYSTILQLLQGYGYNQSNEQPFIFYKEYQQGESPTVTVQVDLLSSEYGGTSRTHRTQQVQDAQPRKARGSDLAFDNFIEVQLAGRLPDGAYNEFRIKVANVVPFLVMKGMALWTSRKEKHPYDIYFIIRNYPGGNEALAGQFHPFLENRLVQEGLGKIRAKFTRLDAIGPVWIVNFESPDDEGEKDRLQRDAYERVNNFLDILGIDGFRE